MTPRSTRHLALAALAALLLALRLSGAPAVEAQSIACLEVGASRCLSAADPLLEPVQALLELPEGQALLRRAADRRVRLRVRQLADDLRGTYVPSTRLVAISREVVRGSVPVRALILAHELQHASEDEDDGSVESCYRSEEAAFRLEARIWPQLWPGQTPPDEDPYEQDANELVRQLEGDPEGFARDLRELYQDDCEAAAEEED